MEAFDITARFLREVTIPIYGYNISLWELFWFVVILGFAVWFIRKFFF